MDIWLWVMACYAGFRCGCPSQKVPQFWYMPQLDHEMICLLNYIDKLLTRYLSDVRSRIRKAIGLMELPDLVMVGHSGVHCAR